MAFPTAEELIELVTPVATAHGLDVENVKTSPAGKKSKVEIKLDSDARPTLDELEKCSNDISAAFDDAEAAGRVNFGAGYTLDVSTPGVDTPLTHPRHWKRNRHRLVDVDGEKVRVGDVNAAETHVIAVVAAKKKAPTVRVLAFSSVNKAVVEIEFSNPPEAELELTGLPFDDAYERQGDDK